MSRQGNLAVPRLGGRSILRVRREPHHRSDRAGEMIVEVVRDGQVVATIYGSREGIQVVSERLAPQAGNTPFRMCLPEAVTPVPSFVLPLLAAGEACPWCLGSRIAVRLGGHDQVPCPVCRREVTEYAG